MSDQTTVNLSEYERVCAENAALKADRAKAIDSLRAFRKLNEEAANIAESYKIERDAADKVITALKAKVAELESCDMALDLRDALKKCQELEKDKARLEYALNIITTIQNAQ